MARRKGAASPDEYHTMCIRVPKGLYNELDDYAWRNRMTVSAACIGMIRKCLMQREQEQ